MINDLNPTGSDLQRQNDAGHDPLDHWYRTETMVEALNLEPGGSITPLRSMLSGDRTLSSSRLGNIDPSTMTVIGQSEGITYGQWLDGPAGTLDIDHSWQFADNVPQRVRTAVERAAKIWSRRLNNHFEPIYEEYYPYYNYEEPLIIDTDDMLIVVRHWTRPGQSSAAAWFWEDTDEQIEIQVGALTLAQGETIDDARHRGHHWLLHVVSHETGHMLWHDFAQDEMPERVERYLDRENHTFNGPRSVAIHGGPVPLQYLNHHRDPVRTGTGVPDYGHLGPCSMVMSYDGGICGSSRNKFEPNELDFEYMDDIGWNVIPAATAKEPEVYGYGAWGEYSAWGVGVERILQSVPHGSDVRYHDWLQASADAFGIGPNDNLADAVQELTGSAQWTGSLHGIDTQQAMLPPVFGDAELRVELATLNGSVRFSDLMTSINEELQSFRRSSIVYNVAVFDNGIADASGLITGSLYGPAHEEMAGVLNDPDIGILAGFGGIRR